MTLDYQGHGPPHPLDRPCCARWWEARRHVLGVSRAVQILSDGIPRYAAAMFARLPADPLGFEPQCPCRDPAVDVAPDPAAFREVLARLATNPGRGIEQTCADVLAGRRGP